MNDAAKSIGLEIAAPLIGAASSLLARLMDGTLSEEQARAELKGILATGAQRLDAFDEIFAARDKTESQRVDNP
jgi:hypothetical protein